MEIHILSDSRLDSVAQWQVAIDREKFPLRLSDIDLAGLRGFLPAHLNGKQTGFEFFQDDAHETMTSLGASHFDRRWQYAFGLRWLGSMDELQVAWMAATAYASATQGIIFDHEEGRVFTPAQARELIPKLAIDAAAMDEILKKMREKLSPR